ncbi:MAG: hypothetical protein IJC00_06340, partial [Clostridia bacterium]|nr:hypothetical protein [Clostridia bacterium]
MPLALSHFGVLRTFDDGNIVQIEQEDQKQHHGKSGSYQQLPTKTGYAGPPRPDLFPLLLLHVYPFPLLFVVPTHDPVYRKWRDSWSNPAKAPAWATEPHCWQQIQMNSPEDELRLRFTDLPKVAAECA